MTPAQEFEKYIDSLGFKHFRGKEFTPYWTRRNGSAVNACPAKALWPNIVPTLVILDTLREALGVPITMTSTYRNAAYNKAVGGAASSLHMSFRAIDFQARGKAPKECADRLKVFRGRQLRNPATGKLFIFHGGIGLYPTFTHVDTRGYDADF